MICLLCVVVFLTKTDGNILNFKKSSTLYLDCEPYLQKNKWWLNVKDLVFASVLQPEKLRKHNVL